MAGLTRADLTAIATRTGRKVVAAWSDHNEGAMGTVYGVVLHHTGSAWGTAVAPTLQIVREGRSDLVNALCTFYIDRAGTIYLVTEKVAWHAGQGAYRGITDGNGHLLGIEAESDGVHWTADTVDAYVALVAEICRFLGADVDTWAIRHATWATPKGRKTDFSGLSELDFKTRVKARLNGTDVDDVGTVDTISPAAIEQIKHAFAEAPIGGVDPAVPLARIRRADGTQTQDVMLWTALGLLATKMLKPTADRTNGKFSDDMLGYELENNKHIFATRTEVEALGGKIDALVAASTQPAVADVSVDAGAVAAALAINSTFLAGLAKAVNDDAARRLAS